MLSYKKIPKMSPEFIQEYLQKLGTQWTGQGVAIELGSWLGGTAVPLLEGLIEAGYDRPFYSFDRWTANKAEVEKAKKQGVRVKDGQNLLPLFLENVTTIYPNIKPRRGMILDTIKEYPGDPIEICVFDAPKTEPTFTEALRVLLPHFIPNVTILGLLDYHFYQMHKGNRRERFMAPVRFMENYSDHFSRIKDWKRKKPLYIYSHVFFRYKKELKI